ncbi:hypothetical protein T261_06034 [Streptomyces lydicus]|nr:hypothetical protein T261_06034 [Streptomyces lydicus]
MNEITIGKLVEILGGFDPEAKVRLAAGDDPWVEYTVGTVVDGDGSIVWICSADELGEIRS